MMICLSLHCYIQLVKSCIIQMIDSTIGNNSQTAQVNLSWQLASVFKKHNTIIWENVECCSMSVINDCGHKSVPIMCPTLAPELKHEFMLHVGWALLKTLLGQFVDAQAIPEDKYGEKTLYFSGESGFLVMKWGLWASLLLLSATSIAQHHGLIQK